jgi:SAM-dependent methyltransferase
MNFSLSDLYRFGSHILTGFRYQREIDLASYREQDISPIFINRKNLKVLDLANGQLQPQSIILRSQGHTTIGIDLINCPKRGIQELGYKLARIFFSKQVGNSTNIEAKTSIVCGNVKKMPFKNNSFDLITSVAAFEHFLDVNSVLQEAHSVLKVGGIIWVEIHLFTSISGGHNFKIMELPIRSIPKGIDAWDHLRSRKLPFRVPLNEWRMHQYDEAFSKYFSILKSYSIYPNGIQFLTQSVREELSDYSIKELTSGGYVIVGQKT